MDGEGKRQRDFADLRLTTWLRRRRKRNLATHREFSKGSRLVAIMVAGSGAPVTIRGGVVTSQPPRRRRCPVHEQPVEPELLGRRGEFHEVHRFPHVAVGAEPVRSEERRVGKGWTCPWALAQS